MKSRLMTVLIQTMASVYSLWFVYIKHDSWFTSILVQLGIDNPKVQLGILTSITLLISNLLVILLGWLFLEVIFKPVKLEIGFRNESGKNNITQMNFEYSDRNVMEIMGLQKSYVLHIKISEGNRITNKIISFLKSDVIVEYRPRYYDTEIVNGWLSDKQLSKDNVYKDKSGNTRIYWSHATMGSNYFDGEGVIISPTLIIKPNNLDGRRCIVHIKLGAHYKSNILLKVISKIVTNRLIKVKINKLTLNLKKV